MEAPTLQQALDAAELACRGLTDRHVVGIGADELQILLEAAGGTMTQLTAALSNRSGRRRVWCHAGLLRQAVKLATGTDQAGRSAA